MAQDDSARDKIEGFMASTFGIGAGSLVLQVVETKLSPGDVVRGRVEVVLREPSEAKRMLVRIRATQMVGRIEARSTTTGKGQTRSEDSRAGLVFSEREVYQQDHELGGELTYSSGDAFDFAVHLPLEPVLKESDNPLAKASRFINEAMTPAQGQVKWFIQARLVFAWHKKDLKRELQLQVE